MKIEFGFGTGVQEVEVPEKNLMGILMANDVPRGLMNEAEVERALANPIGAPRLKDIVRPGEKIAVVTSDITRPCPSWVVLPPLLDRLYEAGIRREDITLVFALGSHRPHTEEEQKHLAGERVFKEIRCIDSDPDDCVRLGVTDAGTPVDIFRPVAEADRVICVANVEYHYFAGYSGGAKSIMPGVSTRSAIQNNHRMMVRDEACAGNIDTNPLRQDIEQAGRILGIDYIVNVVLDEHKNVVYAVAGDSVKAHRVGCAFLDKMYRKPLEKRADIVLVSQGGAPKDLNLYQTQKALDNAKHAVRDGGVVILMGSCREGLGNATFETWMREAKEPQDLIDRVHAHFQLGGHKAAAIAMVLNRAEVWLVSDMPDDLVRDCFLTPYPDAQSALDTAFDRLGKDASVLAMPYGGSTLPRVE